MMHLIFNNNNFIEKLLLLKNLNNYFYYILNELMNLNYIIILIKIFERNKKNIIIIQ